MVGWGQGSPAGQVPGQAGGACGQESGGDNVQSETSKEGLKVKVKVAHLCLTLCNYTVHGILQARILEWEAFPFSRGSSQARD